MILPIIFVRSPLLPSKQENKSKQKDSRSVFHSFKKVLYQYILIALTICSVCSLIKSFVTLIFWSLWPDLLKTHWSYCELLHVQKHYDGSAPKQTLKQERTRCWGLQLLIKAEQSLITLNTLDVWKLAQTAEGSERQNTTDWRKARQTELRASRLQRKKSPSRI